MKKPLGPAPGRVEMVIVVVASHYAFRDLTNDPFQAEFSHLQSQTTGCEQSSLLMTGETLSNDGYQ